MDFQKEQPYFSIPPNGKIPSNEADKGSRKSFFFKRFSSIFEPLLQLVGECVHSKWISSQRGNTFPSPALCRKRNDKVYVLRQ